MRCATRRPGPHRPPHGRLFWRIYGNGLLLVLLVASAVAVVSWIVDRGGPWREPERVTAYVAEHLAALEGDPVRLAAELRRVREVFGVVGTLYAADARTVLASSAEPPLEPLLPPGAVEPTGAPHPHSPGRAVPLPGGKGQAVFVFVGRIGHPGRLAAVLGAVLLAIALGSVPLARAIAAPVERLTQAARALGAGELSTRARLRVRGEVGELGRAFDEMAERLEALVRSEKELLANVSHEVRTPLARIRVALELAAEGDMEKARRYLGEIGADLDELDRLVQDVLAAARLDLAARGGGAWPVRREQVDLTRVLADAAERFRAAWPDRVLEEDVAALAPTLSGDPALLRRMLCNLLDNAAKYSEAPAPVRLTTRAQDGEAVVEVRDEGIGIPAEDLPRLFTPFFRTDRSRARGTGGVGMGLALARRIVQAHGGTLDARPAEVRGTVFRVVLPAQTDPYAAAPLSRQGGAR